MTLTTRIENAVSAVCDALGEWPTLGRWQTMNEDRLFLELAGCLLSTQVPHAMARAATHQLWRSGLLCVSGESSANWRRTVERRLKRPLATNYPRKYRFPSVCAQRLATARRTLGGGLRSMLRHDEDAFSLRSALVAQRCGIGPKQASLFLRNVGWSADLAVLDVHVLAYMCRVGLCAESRVPSSLAAYERLEDRLRAYAHGRGEPLGRLDLAIWITMRLARDRTIAP